MKLPASIKNFLWWLLAIVVVVVCGISFLTNDLEHIEDTNGPDNYDLQVITDKNIIDRDLGHVGALQKKKSILTGDAICFSAKKFTGVTQILYDNLLGKSDFVLDLTSFEVYDGNFSMVIVHNDEIVAELEPGMFVDYRLEDINGTVSLCIAGESAAFQFYISQHDYDSHSHD